MPGDEWLWPDFLEWLNSSTDNTPGDIFLCSNGGHIWLVAKFGSGFNFPKKYIYGSKTDSSGDPADGEDDCLADNWYLIQANGAKPSEVQYKAYTRKELRKLKNDFLTDPKLSNKTFTTSTSAQIVTKLTSILNNPDYQTVITENKGSFFLFSATPLVLLNARLHFKKTPKPEGQTISIQVRQNQILQNGYKKATPTAGPQGELVQMAVTKKVVKAIFTKAQGDSESYSTKMGEVHRGHDPDGNPYVDAFTSVQDKTFVAYRLKRLNPDTGFLNIAPNTTMPAWAAIMRKKQGTGAPTTNPKDIKNPISNDSVALPFGVHDCRPVWWPEPFIELDDKVADGDADG
jgi:hypothetical protein